jgi:hypothetical protein
MHAPVAETKSDKHMLLRKIVRWVIQHPRIGSVGDDLRIVAGMHCPAMSVRLLSVEH